MKSNDLDASSLSRMKKRKRGEIVRRVRDPRSLSQAQAKLAHDLADRYGLEYNLAATYLDWITAVHYHWITVTQAEQETSQRLFDS